MALTPNRIWIALFGVALLSFAGCALGAVDCSVFKPLGLTAALGAAFVSFFDNGSPVREEARIKD
ncbi:MAG: hypothetical protein H6674_00490 [Dehalococcoidia bacterium]|nr:hypothetical protein [Dehalococcoidia bacterium]MCB9484068.1 hypothetical protein [Dehalococcoidia bacterium]MCB9490527.1 hypothetical protein [Dehalococcoidia bacterium]